jgi:hypothetical protein
MTLYHFRWTWARRLWRWRFWLRYGPGPAVLFLPTLALVMLGLWAVWPALSAWVTDVRETYCILHLMVYDSAGFGC